jgi:hypothetical protein
MTEAGLARAMLARAGLLFHNNVQSLTVDKALSSAGGYRSILGVLKHVGGWVHVYRSYAFDAAPRHWEHTSWPRGLRDTVEPTPEYLREIVAWVEDGLRAWDDALAPLGDDDIDRPHPVHWGATAPLGDIVVMITHELMYHTGEINMLLSIARGEAWEYGEEVEENHIDTYGHGVRPPWMSPAMIAAYEAKMRATHEARTQPD